MFNYNRDKLNILFTKHETVNKYNSIYSTKITIGNKIVTVDSDDSKEDDLLKHIDSIKGHLDLIFESKILYKENNND